MPEFLELLPPAEGLALLLRNLPAPEIVVEEVDTTSAPGRVTAGPVVSPEPLPAFFQASHRSP